MPHHLAAATLFIVLAAAQAAHADYTPIRVARPADLSAFDSTSPVHCPKACTSTSDCTGMCLALGCDVVHHQDGSTCSCVSLVSGGRCPDRAAPTPPVTY